MLNFVNGPGSQVGQAILDDPRVNAISFTGSVGTGQRVVEACARHMRKCQTEMGGKNPLVILDDADIEFGRREGANLRWEGERVARQNPGFYLQPALFTDTTNVMRINREEVFGPVASVIRVRDYDEALAVANDTEFGLSAGICTTSLKYASHFKRNSQAGMVMVNLPTAGVDYHVPFGGRKGSSFGQREQGSYAAEYYTTVKTAYTFA